MSKKHKQHSSEFKAKGALAVLKNKATISELANRFGVHPTMITEGKQTLVEGATELFDKGPKVSPRSGSQNQRFSGPHPDQQIYPYRRRDIIIDGLIKCGPRTSLTFPLPGTSCPWWRAWTGKVERSRPSSCPFRLTDPEKSSIPTKFSINGYERR